MITKKGTQSTVNPTQAQTQNIPVMESAAPQQSSNVGVMQTSQNSAKGRYFNPITKSVVDVVEMDMGGSTDQYGKRTGASFKLSDGRRINVKDFSDYIKVDNDFTYAEDTSQRKLSPEEMDVESLEELEDILNDDFIQQPQVHNEVIPQQVQQAQSPRQEINTRSLPQNQIQQTIPQVVQTNNKEDELKSYIRDLGKFKNLLSGSASLKKSTKKKEEQQQEPDGACNAMLDAIITDFAANLIDNKDGIITILDIRENKYKDIVDMAVELHPDFNLKNITTALKKHINKLF